MTTLTKEQRDFLEEQKKKYIDFRLFVIEKYNPVIIENIKEIRDTIRNLSITSGAIGALAISLLDKSVVKNKSTALLALLIFLFVVWEGFFYLKYILEKENNQLHERTNVLHEAITKVRDQINKALNNDSHEEALKFLEVSKQLEEVVNQEDKKIDNWFVKNIGNLTLIPFSVACILIIVSFISFDFLKFQQISIFLSSLAKLLI